VYPLSSSGVGPGLGVSAAVFQTGQMLHAASGGAAGVRVQQARLGRPSTPAAESPGGAALGSSLRNRMKEASQYRPASTEPAGHRPHPSFCTLRASDVRHTPHTTEPSLTRTDSSQARTSLRTLQADPTQGRRSVDPRMPQRPEDNLRAVQGAWKASPVQLTPFGRLQHAVGDGRRAPAR
jgi:hypothetical protein